MAPVSAALNLSPHPESPRIELSVSVLVSAEPRELVLHYRVSGDTAAVRWPEPQGGGMADGLWRHTCFEAFVGRAQAAAYHEFNFSPAGDWAAYAFSGPRQRASADQLPLAPRLQWQRADDTLTLTVELPRQALPAADHTDLLLGLSAVIEARDGQLSCWALAHPAPQPDFHHRAGWTARLP